MRFSQPPRFRQLMTALPLKATSALEGINDPLRTLWWPSNGCAYSLVTCWYKGELLVPNRGFALVRTKIGERLRLAPKPQT